MHRKSLFILTISILFVSSVYSQGRTNQSVRIAFYNVENFFDTNPDTLLHMDDFTPGGNHHWNSERYKTKLNRIYKVITALGGWQSTGIMGFAEIENRKVLTDIIEKTPLKKEGYRLVHYESHDHRGIDAGLIYLPEVFTVLYSKAVPLVDSTDPGFHTRDILYVKGLLMGDTLHLFVNHWPSRYGGMMQTISKRKLAAALLRRLTDSICNYDSHANILVMGDFNDNPDDESIKMLTSGGSNCFLKSLPWETTRHLAAGSLKHASEWAVFDQILVTEPLTAGKAGLRIATGNYFIYDAPFLLEKDKKYPGYTTNRTWRGFSYNGGFSDHLPVFIDIVKSSIAHEK